MQQSLYYQHIFVAQPVYDVYSCYNLCTLLHIILVYTLVFCIIICDIVCIHLTALSCPIRHHWYCLVLASTPGRTQLSNVCTRKAGGLGIRSLMTYVMTT